MSNPTLVEEAVELLKRWLKLADSGHYRDTTHLSIAAHPLADGTRTLLAALPTDDDEVTEAMIEAGRNAARQADNLFTAKAMADIYKAMRGAAIHTLMGRG